MVELTRRFRDNARMSLPPGFLDELRNRLSLGQVVGRKVMWDTRKSNQGKGDLWAPCPFHQEKTASFHVDDRKGFYYCFGCHAKGDAISFVRETENVDFMEAVKILAAEAGMPVPERDPQAQQKADKRTQLTDVMEQAVKWHRLQLQTGAAAEARDYLERRGLSAEAQARWEIGFAPTGGGVLAALTGKGIEQKHVIEAGLAAESDRGGEPYDRFRGRIMFPIRDARGRAIGFGGRAMDPNHPAKYYNSPETPLFDKGRSLYNHGPAREAAGKGKPLIVAEGYMDVIALSEAGFTATVAPLGTAITEDQLRLLWRIADEPIIALDGDTAGLRAAMRVIDIALPLLEAGKSLRFALMPEGLDPDDVLKAQGAGAMKKLIDQAIPMVQLLWRREIEGKAFDSPERKASLDKALREKIAVIADKEILQRYRDEIWRLKADLFRSKRSNKFDPSSLKYGATTINTSQAKQSFLASDGAETITRNVREAATLALAMRNPELVEEFLTEFERIEYKGNFHDRVSRTILKHAPECGGVPKRLERKIIQEHGEEILDQITDYSHVKVVIAVLEPNNPNAARQAIAEEFSKIFAEEALEREVREATLDMVDNPDEGLTWRLKVATEALRKARQGNNEDRTEYEVGENGARIKKDERSAFDNLLDQIDFAKGHKRSNS